MEMKKSTLTKAIALMMAVALSFVSCGKDSPSGVKVSGVEIGIERQTMALSDRLTLTATVLPEEAANKNVSWKSSDPAVAEIDGEGNVTPVKLGTTILTVTTAEGGYTDVCELSVTVIGKPGFKTADTWTVTDGETTQEWSDVVMVSGARGKSTYDGGESNGYEADVLENPGYGDLFSWEAVVQNKELLCPAPWRVPTKDDFVVLDILLGGTGDNVWGDPAYVTATYLDPEKWGGAYGGSCDGSGEREQQGSSAEYWSQTEWLSDYAFPLVVNDAGLVYPQFSYERNEGRMLRCVQGDQKPIPVVTGVELSAEEETISVGGELTLTATVLPEEATNREVMWSSDKPQIATVTDGVVSGMAPGIAIITVTTVEGGYTDTCTVTVEEEEAGEHPVFGVIGFVTEKTWSVGTQTWSDTVTASAARGKTEYSGGNGMGEYYVDFVENPGYGDLFSWQAVDLYKEALCPAPWRMPVRQDFIDLDVAMGGNGENRWAESNVAYINDNYLNPAVWGGALGGRMDGFDFFYLTGQTFWGHYWTQTSDGNTGNAYLLSISFDGEVNPQTIGYKAQGFPVRCVK